MIKIEFEIGDKIAFVKKTTITPEVLNVGTIIEGPFKIDKINHYKVKWDNITPNHYPGGTEIEFISPMESTKYGWRLL